jgi:8-oxo-dGTP pyrophosphatase MutT (NUDIX family)
VTGWKRLGRQVRMRLLLTVRGMTLGVRTIAFDGAGRVLLVRHGYTPGWHFPGGGVDHHETLEEAALRELEEETGHVAAGPSRFLGMAYNRHQWKGDHVGVFVVEGLTKVREITPGFEIAEIGFFHPDDLPEGTTAPTRTRLDELRRGLPVAAYWSG